MYKGGKYGLVILSCLVMCYLCVIPCYANQYVLDQSITENSPAVYSWSLATDSDADIMFLATDSDAGIMPLSSYNDVYDGSISSSVVTYMKGIVSRFSPSVHYVLFRESQHIYRLVYGGDLQVNNSVFTGSDLKYIRYDTRNYIVSEGYEGDFSLNVSSYTVYTDLESMYPVLYEGVTKNEGRAILFGVTVMLLFDVVKAFFGSGKSRYKF